MEQWSQRWGWVQRVEAWADEQDRARRERVLTDVAQMNERHATLAMGITGRVAVWLNSLTEEQVAKAAAQWCS